MRKTTTAPPELRVLLIDDNRNGLLARKVLLEQEGFLVTSCSSPEEGLDRFSSDAYDIVVTDYRMPRMNGIELIAEIRKLRADVPVVLVSGMVDVLGLNEMNTGADAVVAKNATEVSHMVRAVNRLVRKPAPKKAVSSQVRQPAKRTKKVSNS